MAKSEKRIKSKNKAEKKINKENISTKKVKKITKRKNKITKNKTKKITNVKIFEKLDILDKRFTKIEETLNSMKEIFIKSNSNIETIKTINQKPDQNTENEKQKKKDTEKLIFLKKIKLLISNEISQNFNFLNKKILSNFQNLKKIKKIDIKKNNFFSPILEDRNRNLVFSMKEIVDKLESKSQFTFGDINNFIKSNQDQDLKVSLKGEDYDLLKENIEFCDDQFDDGKFEESVKKDFENLKEKFGNDINLDAFCLK